MFSYKELCGTIHLHTKYSDGGVDYPTLQRTALEVGLNFIIVTDHMSLGGLKDGFEGIKDNLIVIVGYEHQDPDNLNHYLAIGVNEVLTKSPILRIM
jgi:predicted metal-dependent phosphoesterase TrpH